LAPARDLEVGKAAIQAGADAVYIGAPEFGARQAAGNSMEDIAELVQYAHGFGVQVLVTLNTLLHDNEYPRACALAHELYKIGVDALIIQDLNLLNHDLPPIRLHASTQCDNRTPEQVLYLQQMGFRRVVLARELSLEKIKELFADYLFPIWQWSHLQKTRDFTDKEIDIYKGVDEYSPYTFAKRINKARPYFQIPQPFVAGHDFFEMVNHYLHLLETIRIEIATNHQLLKVHRIVNIPKKKKDYEHLDDQYKEYYDCARHNTGMSYARDLFECALLCYYDKFHNFDVMAIKKLCMWAFKIRVVREFLGFDSINKYAIGEGPDSDNISLFAIINMARDHREIAALQIKLPTHISGNSNQALRRNIITLLNDL
jgi:hypothetical protein